MVMKIKVLFFFLLCTVFQVSAQNRAVLDTIAMDEVYMENELVYRYADDERFTGISQSKRKNGHLTYEGEYQDGVILVDYQYYNGKQKVLSHKTLYNRYKPWIREKEYFYGSKGKWNQTTYFDENGKKKLVEQHKKDGRLYYRCTYVDGKKHGKEICFEADGSEIVDEFLEGKKVKKKKRKK